MDELSTRLLTIPIFFPMVRALDFGMPKEPVAIWFGIMVWLTVGFDLIAPNDSSVHTIDKPIKSIAEMRGLKLRALKRQVTKLNARAGCQPRRYAAAANS